MTRLTGTPVRTAACSLPPTASRCRPQVDIRSVTAKISVSPTSTQTGLAMPSIGHKVEMEPVRRKAPHAITTSSDEKIVPGAQS